MAEDFGVEDRGHFYDPVGALRDVVVNHLMQVVAACAMESPSRGDPTTIKDAQVALFRCGRRRRPGPLRARTVRRLSRHRRCRARLDDRDVRRPAPRHRELALVGRPLLHPNRQAAAGDADRAPARLQASAAARLQGVRPPAGAEPARRQARPVDGDPARSRGASRRRRGSGAGSTSTWSSREKGGEGPTPYEVLLHAAMVGDSTRFTRQDGVEETWRIMQPLLDAPPPVDSYAPGTWGPEAADRLVAGHGRWHGPWLCHERRVERPPRARRRARPRRRRSRRSRTTRSSPTATPVRSLRRTGRSTGSAFRPSTRRASSAACSTGRPGSSGSGRTGSTIPRPATSSRGRTCW